MTTHTDLEAGIDTSKPLELYKFTIDTQEYFYTSADIDITYSGNTYLKSTITRGELDGTSDPDKGVIDLTVPYTLPIAQQVITTPPSMPINLVVFRGQRNDPGVFIQQWVGRLIANEVIGSVVSLKGVSILSNQYRVGNALRFQKACPYALYDSYNCKIVAASYEYICSPTATTASKLSSADLVWTVAIPTHTTLKEGWFLGGYVEYSDTFSNVVGKRAIIDYDHLNGIVTVFPQLRGFVDGTPVKFYPGCAHDSRSCKLKFDNVVNYGGDPILPLDDPFDPTTEVF